MFLVQKLVKLLNLISFFYFILLLLLSLLKNIQNEFIILWCVMDTFIYLFIHYYYYLLINFIIPAEMTSLSLDDEG